MGSFHLLTLCVADDVDGDSCALLSYSLELLSAAVDRAVPDISGTCSRNGFLFSEQFSLIILRNRPSFGFFVLLVLPDFSSEPNFFLLFILVRPRERTSNFNFSQASQYSTPPPLLLSRVIYSPLFGPRSFRITRIFQLFLETRFFSS